MDWRNTKEYRTWRAHVVRRDAVCQVCGSRKERHAHHLDDANTNPEIKFEVSNGITLCRTHHTMLHTVFNQSYLTSCSVKDYDDFKEMYDKLFEEFKTTAIENIKTW